MLLVLSENEYRGTCPATRRPEGRAPGPGRCYQLCRPCPFSQDVLSHDFLLLVLFSLYRGRSSARYTLGHHAMLYNIPPSNAGDAFSSRVYP